MTYDDALALWHGRINYEVRAAAPADLKLERMRAFLAKIGDPHDRLRIVHVTGTKGKGSVAAMVAAILRAAGFRVGLFISPHLVNVEERIQIDGEPITRGELAAAVTDLAPAVRELEASEAQAPTFFEIGTALGFAHFARRGVDVAVVEVGLGGRFDSTNVCTPVVSVITSVGLDHVAQLGNTLEAIAFQKAGIIKPGVPVVSGVAAPGPREVVAAEAAANHAPVWLLGRDFFYAAVPGRVDAAGVRRPRVQISTPRADYAAAELNLFGPHQAANAAVAVATIERVREAGLDVPDAAIFRGLAGVKWPARVELVGTNPVRILDCAHNDPSAEALVTTLRESFPAAGPKVLVFAVSADKPYAEMLARFAGYFDRFVFTKYAATTRAVPPEQLLEASRRVAAGTPAVVVPAAADAWRAAVEAAGGDGLACAAGSVFLAGELAQFRGEPGARLGEPGA